jgi:hypothetical protein
MTAGVTVSDTSGLIRGVTGLSPTDRRLTSDEYDRLNLGHVLALQIACSNDLYLSWTTGVCWPDQEVTVSGTAAALAVHVDEGPIATGPCDLVGTGITLRLSMAASVNLANLVLSR